MNRLTTFLISMAAAAVLLLISACGQSGPLFIPGNPSQIAVPPSQSSDAEDDREEDGQEENGESSTPE